MDSVPDSPAPQTRTAVTQLIIAHATRGPPPGSPHARTTRTSRTTGPSVGREPTRALWR
jgi:hypothetical protein